MPRGTKAAVALTAAVALGVLTGCSFDKTTEPYNDAPRQGNDTGPATIVAMPDGFNNVATKCIKGTDVRVTVIYHQDSAYGAVSTVVDPDCK